MAIAQITIEQLRSLMATPENFKLLDVLPRESYRLHHIPGAISMPLDEIGQRAHLLLQKNDTIVVYCAGSSCEASDAAAEILTTMGFTQVLTYRGGLIEFHAAGGRLDAGFDSADYSNSGCGI